MSEIPNEMSLLWIAKFLGEPPTNIYKLNQSGNGPVGRKIGNRYVISKAAFLLWLSNRPRERNS